MSKKITFGTNPRKKEKSIDADNWVKKGTTAGKQETTRFTIDIPTELHAKIKSFCALKKVKMKEEIQVLLEKHFKEL